MATFFTSKNYAIFVLFQTICVDLITLSFVLVLLPKFLQQYYCQLSLQHFDNSSIIPSNESVSYSSENFKNYTSSKTYLSVEQNLTTDNQSGNNTAGSGLTCDDVTISHHIGIIAGLGPLIEIILLPLAKYIISKIGRKRGYCLGGILQLIGVLFWYFISQEWGIFVGRGVQSLGSSLSMIAGFANLASLFPQDSERVSACSKAYMGMAVGYLIGYISGGYLHETLGRYNPFIFVIGLNILDIIMRTFVSSTEENAIVEVESGEWSYFDRYIILNLYITFVAYSVHGLTITSLPKRLEDTHGATQGQVGVVYTLATVSEVLAQLVVTIMVKTHHDRCTTITASFMIAAIGLFIFPFVPNVWVAIVPLSLVRIAEGIFGGMCTSLYSYLADRRCSGDYNHLYAVLTMTYSSAFGLAPLINGYFLPWTGFRVLYIANGVIVLVTMFPTLFLWKL